VEARNRPKDTEPETALVFRDRHVEEVRNYAISKRDALGANAPAAKKIPLDQLDLAATVKMNRRSRRGFSGAGTVASRSWLMR